MGTDNSVCDAARVSMDKVSTQFTDAQNASLLNYLAKHNHWSPFAHCMVSFRFKAPIFIARQFQKHQVGFAWNEVSRRYVSSAPEFWSPPFFRQKAPSVKQGSLPTPHDGSAFYVEMMDQLTITAQTLYNAMIKDGVCPEQARAVLPQSMMTEWIWTGSLYAWARMYDLRIDPHAQAECAPYALLVDKQCRELFPLAWSALTERSS